MSRIAVLLLLVGAACGDNLAPEPGDPGFEGSFDDDGASVFFGKVEVAAPPAPTMAVLGATICIEGQDECTTSEASGSFVLPGPGGEGEVEIVASAPDLMTTHNPTHPSITGDRNLDSLLLVSAETIEQSALAFGIDPMLASRGVILVLPYVFGDGPFVLAVDGATTRYLVDGLPAPEATSFDGGGAAVIFGVAPGEAVLRSTEGSCEANSDGWPGDLPGTLRLPVVAGEVTIVRPFCIAG